MNVQSFTSFFPVVLCVKNMGRGHEGVMARALKESPKNAHL